MTHSQFEIVLQHYEAALTELELATRSKFIDTSRRRTTYCSRRHLLLFLRKIRLHLEKRHLPAPVIPPDRLLNVLKARDAVHEALQQSIPDEKIKLMTVVNLDRRLKKQAKWVVRAVHLDDWRTSFNPPPEAWWWFLEQQFGLGWRFLSVVLLAISFSLIGNVMPRFLTGGLDFAGTLAVIFQSVFALIAGGSIFSKTAGKKLAKLFPRRLREEWGTVLALSLLTFLLLFQLSLPQIGAGYRDRGFNDYKAGRLSSAEFNYQRSLALNPNDGRTHFYLGSLYEAVNDLDAARSEHQIAMASGSAAAYNHMARLYILDENYDSATFLLRQLESKFMIRPKRDEMVHYNLHMNMGWVRLRQGLLAEVEVEKQIYLAEAKATLLTAIEIAEEHQFAPKDQAPAHCLLAQVIEARGYDPQQALADWEYCLDHSLALTPEEDAWKVEAQKRLMPTEIPTLGGGGS